MTGILYSRTRQPSAFIMKPDCYAAFGGCECDGLGLVPNNSCIMSTSAPSVCRNYLLLTENESDMAT